MVLSWKQCCINESAEAGGGGGEKRENGDGGRREHPPTRIVRKERHCLAVYLKIKGKIYNPCFSKLQPTLL